MKITLDLLKKINACAVAKSKFFNTKELHDIDIDNVNEVIVGDKELFDHINWLIISLKGKLLISKLTYKDSNGNSKEYTYDDKGNMLTRKDSDGNSKEWTYDEKYNLSIFEIK